jgi:hypothetical protein
MSILDRLANEQILIVFHEKQPDGLRSRLLIDFGCEPMVRIGATGDHIEITEVAGEGPQGIGEFSQDGVTLAKMGKRDFSISPEIQQQNDALLHERRALFHSLWTKGGCGPEYDKSEWKKLAALMHELGVPV